MTPRLHGTPQVFNIRLLNTGRQSGVLGDDDVRADYFSGSGFTGRGLCLDGFVETVKARAGDGEDWRFVGEEDGKNILFTLTCLAEHLFVLIPPKAKHFGLPLQIA